MNLRQLLFMPFEIISLYFSFTCVFVRTVACLQIQNGSASLLACLSIGLRIPWIFQISLPHVHLEQHVIVAVNENKEWNLTVKNCIISRNGTWFTVGKIDWNPWLIFLFMFLHHCKVQQGKLGAQMLYNLGIFGILAEARSRIIIKRNREGRHVCILLWAAL